MLKYIYQYNKCNLTDYLNECTRLCFVIMKHKPTDTLTCVSMLKNHSSTLQPTLLKNEQQFYTCSHRSSRLCITQSVSKGSKLFLHHRQHVSLLNGWSDTGFKPNNGAQKHNKNRYGAPTVACLSSSVFTCRLPVSQLISGIWVSAWRNVGKKE